MESIKVTVRSFGRDEVLWVDVVTTPGEPMTHDSPGSDPEWEIKRIYCNGARIPLNTLTDDEREVLEDLIFLELKKGNMSGH